MSNCYVLDTSFICSLLNENDVNHVNALKLYEEISEKDKLYFNIVNFLELALFKTKFSEFEEFDFRALLDDLKVKYVKINKQFILDYEDFCVSTRLKMKPVDYTVLFSAYINDAEILTFDKKLLKVRQALN